MKNLLDFKFTSSNGVVLSESGEKQSFVAKREPIGEKCFAEDTVFSFIANGDVELSEYIVLEYSCFGILRPEENDAAVLSALRADDKFPLVVYSDITANNAPHRVIAKAPSGKFSAICCEYRADKMPVACFEIHSLYTCGREELPEAFDKGENIAVNEFTPVDISGLFNDKYDFDENKSIIDSGVFFNKKTVSAYGVPFNVGTDERNIVSPDGPPKENDEPIVNFGAHTTRGLCRPVSRDSETVVEIGKKASEIFFILTLSKKRHMRTKYAVVSSVLGTPYVDVVEPLRVEDVEFFMAEVVYKDGRRDTHLPLNLYTGRHGISGDVSVYGIPCDGSEVKKLIIHNRMIETDVSLAAVTVNETEKRLYPDMCIPEKEERIMHNADCEKHITLDDNILTVKNGALYMKLDTSKGLWLSEMKNAFIPGMKIKSGSMLKLRDEKGNITSDFQYISSTVRENTAEIKYDFNGVIFQIGADISGENSVKWTLEVNNRTNAEFKKGIIFPCISGIDFGDASDNWYFVPKYQNIESNEMFFMYEESAPSFPMQFMDVFSKKAQGGMALTTEERGLVTRKYALEKNDSGIEFYVEYPVIYGDIGAKESFKASPAVVTCHEGDWKKAFDIYKEWLSSWYSPYKCQNKQWYRECFWLLAEITDFYETHEITKFPCWYDEGKKKFNFRDILEEQKEITGVYPDILHMWSWTNQFVNGEYAIKWGNFGGEDYDKYGGVETFRNALHDIKDNMGINVSLYMHPTLLTEAYPQSERFFPTSKVVNEAGENITIIGNSTRMCHAENSWREFALSMYPRIYKELGITLLYVDEFSLRIENRCYAPNHGHRVPSSLLKTDNDFITRLRESMPEEVVLYGEYAAVDVNARYIDCNISYYILDSIVDMIETARRVGDGDDRMSRVFMNVYRFAFPKIVQLILPMAMRKISWHPQKFMFFNGEAVYDAFWDTEESRGTEFNTKAYKIKKAYADCFTSDSPEMMIETESPAICINKFPAKIRTLYTIYNRAYSTYRGTVLKIPHTVGMRYYDVWNEKELEVNVSDGFAEIFMEIGAMEMGCIVAEKVEC